MKNVGHNDHDRDRGTRLSEPGQKSVQVQVQQVQPQN